jgi:hypothetical protein
MTDEQDSWPSLEGMSDHELMMSEIHGLRLLMKELREIRSMMTYGFIALGILLLIALGWMFFLLFHLTRLVLAP